MALPRLGLSDNFKRERAEYIANLPYDEKLVREVISGLKDAGYFYKSDFDPKTVGLETILAPPTSRLGGVKILGLTRGPGEHLAEVMFLSRKYAVAENEVMVTVDNIAPLAGSITTYKFKREENSLRIIGRDVHVMS